MRRKKVGLLIESLDNNYAIKIVKGVQHAADEMNVDLIIFFGGYFYEEFNNYEYQKNMICAFADHSYLDLLIISIDSLVVGSHKYKQDILQYFKDIPIVTLNNCFDGFSSVGFNNEAGLNEAIEYMINHLGKKHLVMLNSGKDSHDAKIRETVFRNVLNKYDLLKSEDQIGHTFHINRNAEEDVKVLLDKNPQIDALVCFNDETAISSYHTLKKEHLEVGKDVSVLGFDDIHEACLLEPPLSSIYAPPSLIGYTALKRGLAMIEDHQVFHEVLPSQFMLRESLKHRLEVNESLEKKIIDCLKEPIQYEELWLNIKKYVFEKSQVIFDERIYDSFQKMIFDFISFKKINYNDDFYYTLNSRIDDFFKTEYLEYIDLKRVIYVLDLINHHYLKFDCVKEMLEIISLKLNSMFFHQRRNNYRDNNNMNMMARRMMIFDNNKECYQHILESLRNLNVSQASLYLFDTPISKKYYYEISKDERIDLVGFIRDKEEIVLNRPIKMSVGQVFENETINQYANKLEILSLYANENLYGVLICDFVLERHSSLSFLDVHIGSAIHTLHLVNQLNKKTLIDPLTGLYNRRGILEMADEFIEESYTTDSIYIVYADLDHLKPINDIYGHEEGDIAIKKAGKILEKVFRNKALIGRVGGDEFVIIFKSSKDQVFEDINQLVKESALEINTQIKRKIDVSISYGIKKIDKDNYNLEKEMNAADKLMYINKMKQ